MSRARRRYCQYLVCDVHQEWIARTLFLYSFSYVLFIVGAASNITTTFPIPFSRYIFDEQSCHNVRFTDSGSNSIQNTPAILFFQNRNNSISATSEFDCVPGIGLQIKKESKRTKKYSNANIVTNGSLQYVWEDVLFSKRGVSIEVWFRTPTPQSQSVNPNIVSRQPIVTIDQYDLAATASASIFFNDALNSCDRYGYDFQLSQIGDTIIDISFRTNDPYFEKCQTIQIPIEKIQDNPDREGKRGILNEHLNHILISLNDSIQIVYVNGIKYREIRSVPFSNDLHHWNITKNRLQLFGNDPLGGDILSDSPIWEGILYQIAFYVGDMTETSAQDLLVNGLPYSKSYTFNQTITINEDAEIVPGSHKNDWYRQKQLNLQDAATIPGPEIISVDQELLEILVSLGLEGRRKSVSSSVTYVYITKLPHVGKLYVGYEHALESRTLNGANNDLFYIGFAPVKSMVYMPPFNEHSISANKQFTNYSYCIAQQPIFNVTQCSSNAHVQIIVNSVNDPPIATIPFPATVVIEGSSISQRIPLLGSDIDDVDISGSITAVQITRIPQFGLLRLSVPTFRKDNNTHGTSLSSLGYIVSGYETVFVTYEWEPSKYSGLVRGLNNTTDVFYFRVQDNDGAWSNEVPVDIRIQSALTIESTEDSVDIFIPSLYNDAKYSIKSAIKDLFGSPRFIGLVLDTIVKGEVGGLFDSVNGKRLVNGSILRATNIFSDVYEASVVFQPNSTYCNPTGDRTLVKSYEIVIRAVAFESNTATTVVSSSEPQTRSINVVCEQRAIELLTPLKSFTTLESSLERTQTDLCYGGNYDPDIISDSSQCTASVIIEGIYVRYDDWLGEPVLVTTTTQMGYVTFNKKFRKMIDIVHGRSSMASGNITFYTNAENLNNVLSKLHYTSFTTGTDRLKIELRYGGCPKPGIKADNTIHIVDNRSLCYSTETFIDIVVMRDPTKYTFKTRMVIGFPWQIIMCLVGYPTLYVAVVFLMNNVSEKESDASTTMLGSAEYPLERWIQHTADNGMYYYENMEDGTVTWQAPPPDEDVVCRPSEEP